MAKKWTVMVYMAADEAFTSGVRFGDLTEAAYDDVFEMMEVGSIDNQLDIVVQVDRKVESPVRARILPGRAQVLQRAPDKVDMAEPLRLRQFLEWATRTFPSDHSMLVLWGHAYRFAFGYDGANSLDFVELSDVLRQYKVNILGFDTCGLSTIESAYQLRDCADYMVASEINIPLLGWPYDRILRALRDKPDMDPQALGYTIVKKYVQSFPGGTVALSMLNLGNAEAMIRPMRNLGASLALAAGTDAVQRERLLRLFRNARIPTSTHDPLVDLRKLCGELRAPANGLDRAVQLAASQLDTALDDGNGLVAYHSGRGDGAEDLGGVSAFAPHVGRRRDSILQVYDRLDFSQVQPGQEASPTLWPEVVRFLALAN